MQKEKISNWDLTEKLLNDNEMKIGVNRNMKEKNLYLVFKNIPEDFYLSSSLGTNGLIYEYVNKMSVSNFRDFYEELSKKIIKIKDISFWKEKLIEEYKMDMKNEKI
jgi:hypothetical protein